MKLLINLFCVFLITVLPACVQAQIDSLEVYELEPIHFTEKRGDVSYTIFNYFSNNKKKKRSKNFYPMVKIPFQTSTFGVRIHPNTENDRLFVKDISFFISKEDTLNIHTATYCVLVEKENKAIEKIQLTKTKLLWKSSKQKGLRDVCMVYVVFESLEIPFSKNDKIYVMKEIPSMIHNNIIINFNTLENQNLFHYQNNELIHIPYKITNPSESPSTHTHINNVAWQARIRVLEYKGEE
jgi:hypothetical protein